MSVRHTKTVPADAHDAWLWAPIWYSEAVPVMLIMLGCGSHIIRSVSSDAWLSIRFTGGMLGGRFRSSVRSNA